MLTAEQFVEAGNYFNDQKHDLATAIAFYRQALSADPTHLPALIDLGNALAHLNDDQAGGYLDLAKIQDPNNPFVLAGYGKVALTHGHITESVDYFRSAVERYPTNGSFHRNLAYAYQLAAEFAHAEEHYALACQFDPTDMESRTFLGMMQMLTGRLVEGGLNYDARLMFQSPFLRDGSPVWDGEASLDGKRISIQMEQGDGDSVMCARYASALRQLWHCEVFICCQPHLAELLAFADGVRGIRRPGPDAIKVDYQVAAMSLPRLLFKHGMSRGLGLPYLNGISKARLSPSDDFTVGLCWAGSPSHANDRYRSLPDAALLRPLTEDRNIQFVSLQHGPRAGEVEKLFLMQKPDTRSWVETAEFIAGLDLLITVDTAVAHVAGALDVPVWILVAANPDWRWGTVSCRTDWYHSARLYRQEKLGEWEPVLARVQEDLARGCAEFRRCAKSEATAVQEEK